MRKRPLVIGAIVLLLATPAALIGLITQPGVAPQPSQPPQVDAARLQAHVKHLSVDLHLRNHEQLDHLEQAARYIEAELRHSGATTSSQPVQAGGHVYRNLVARFGPQDGPRLVIGAHYDSHGDTPGADDNASGVAGLLELARLLGQHPPQQPVELVAYTLEEPPYFRTASMGSTVHARALKAAGTDVRLMLALEMIGLFSDAPGSQSFPVPAMSQLYSDRGDFIALVGRFADFGAMRRAKALMAGASPLPVRSINAPPLLEGIDFSDHLSYWAAGYPALMVTDTAFFRNDQYHLPGDTHDRLDYRRMAQVVQGVYALAQRY